ncbi:Retrotransposon-derived protein PEG10 [Labeo rohita]|uniref:Retrotransposon-derived protein PEG10 n=1 Tax=Labeo rohita TaxID=84645 RepID=A0ABQ8MZJ0_LABRO|nr:Retrotransposon-derived protein PEG10 [Labeo rohita]
MNRAKHEPDDDCLDISEVTGSEVGGVGKGPQVGIQTRDAQSTTTLYVNALSTRLSAPTKEIGRPSKFTPRSDCVKLREMADNPRTTPQTLQATQTLTSTPALFHTTSTGVNERKPTVLRLVLFAHQQQLDRLTDLTAQLVRALQGLQLTTPPVSPPAAPLPPAAQSVSASLRLAFPEKFDGAPTKCKGFLLQCSLFVSQQPHFYPTEESKVVFVCSLLTGRALDWATAVWRLDLPTFPSFAAFMQRFKEVFQPSTENGKAGEQIMALRQGRRTAADYALSFRTLAAQSGWTDEPLKLHYRNGLYPDLQMELACRDEGLSLEQYIDLSIRVDNLMRARKPGRLSTAVPLAAPSSEASPEPMQLGATKLTLEERERRLRGNLCLYCGLAGHIRATRPSTSDLLEAFSRTKATQLPPHHPGDCAIDLVPGATPPRGRIFPLSQAESEAMNTYIQEELAKGFITPSTSPASAGFFFVKKKDGGLPPCIDYRGLNEVTIPNLPLISPLSSASLDFSHHCFRGRENPLNYQQSTPGSKAVRRPETKSTSIFGGPFVTPSYKPTADTGQVTPTNLDSGSGSRPGTSDSAYPARNLVPGTWPAGPPEGEEDLDETASQGPPSILIDGEEVYRVNTILDSRRRRGQIEYLVDWEGFGPEERSWVVSGDILEPSLTTDFHSSHPDRPAPRGRGRPRRRAHPRAGSRLQGGGLYNQCGLCGSLHLPPAGTISRILTVHYPSAPYLGRTLPVPGRWSTSSRRPFIELSRRHSLVNKLQMEHPDRVIIIAGHTDINIYTSSVSHHINSKLQTEHPDRVIIIADGSVKPCSHYTRHAATKRRDPIHFNGELAISSDKRDIELQRPLATGWGVSSDATKLRIPTFGSDSQ